MIYACVQAQSLHVVAACMLEPMKWRGVFQKAHMEYILVTRGGDTLTHNSPTIEATASAPYMDLAPLEVC